MAKFQPMKSAKKAYSRCILMLLLTIGVQIVAQGQSPKFTYKGYVKELGGLSFNDNLSTARFDNIIHNRIETTWRLNNQFRFQLDARNRIFTGYTVSNVPNFGNFLSNDPGFVDLSENWVDNSFLIFNSHIDRLHASYISGAWEAHIGRQRINWGKTMVWNPNDLFNAYAYLDFDYEERPGTDAINIQYNWSFASSVEVGYKVANNANESVFAAMYRGNLGTYDVQFLAGRYQERFTLGTGWSGYIKNAGFKGELSYFFAGDGQDASLSASLGSDYMFASGVFGSVEVLYNGGHQRNLNTAAAIAQPPSASNLFVSDTGYFLNAVTSAHPLVNFGVGVMGSFTQELIVLIPQTSISLAENVDLLVLMQTLHGSAFAQTIDTPNVVYSRLKWSF